MSVPDPLHPGLRRYDRGQMRQHYMRTRRHFTVYAFGPLVPPLANCSFVQRDGFNNRIYCKDTRRGPHIVPRGIDVDYTAVVFEVIGRLEREDCYITPEGDRDHPLGSDANLKFASFWLRAPGDDERARSRWQARLRTIAFIARRALGGHAEVSELVAPRNNPGSVRPDGPAALQVCWTPPCGYDLHALPLFTARHEHIALTTLAIFPFEKRIRVHFTLHCLPYTAGGSPIVGARMLYMHVLD